MNVEFDWEWQGINFLMMPSAFKDSLIIRVVPDIFAEYKDEQLDQVFAVMALTPQHTYQVLTKRPERMLNYFTNGREKHPNQTWLEHRSNLVTFEALKITKDSGIHSSKVNLPLPNCWLGVTVENQATAGKRIPLLLQTPAAVRFLSCEPLLEDVDLANAMTLGGPDLDWVIVGGESGHNARPCDVAWIHSIVEQCKEAEVPCFVKQLGSKPDEWPECIRVRQTPSVEVTA